MVHLNAESVITALTDQFLDRKSYPDYDNGVITRPGLVFELWLRLSYYAEDADERCEEFDESVMMFIVVCGGTNVFVSTQSDVGFRFFNDYDSLDSFDNTSNHDSCWRSDGIHSPITDTYFQLCERINDRLENAGYERVAPVEMFQHNQLGLFGGKLFKHCTVSHAAVDPQDTYRRKIVKLELQKD